MIIGIDQLDFHVRLDILARVAVVPCHHNELAKVVLLAFKWLVGCDHAGVLVDVELVGNGRVWGQKVRNPVVVALINVTGANLDHKGTRFSALVYPGQVFWQSEPRSVVIDVEDVDGEEHLPDERGLAAVPGGDLQLEAGLLLPVQWTRCLQVKVGHLRQ